VIELSGVLLKNQFENAYKEVKCLK